MAKDEKDACYQILSFGLSRNLVVYNTRLLLAKPNIPPLKEELHVKENIVLEERGNCPTLLKRVCCV